MFDFLSRRTLLSAPAALAVVPTAQAQQATNAYTPQPLAVDPARIPGLSEKLIVSHYENNYLGAVRRLNAIRQELAALDLTRAPTFQVNGLKREELLAFNSMLLHELHFAGLGAGEGPGPSLSKALARDFGSVDQWKASFAATGKALGGGSGWVLLTYMPRDGRLVNVWAADHTMTLAGGTPLLALDMYEHAYHMDYGAKAAGYVDAFMAAIRWSHVDEVYARATRT